MFCPDYLFIKDHYIRTLSDLEQVFLYANKDTSSSSYVGLEDAIRNKTIISWIQDKVGVNENNDIEEICNSVISNTMTLDDGIKNLTKLLFNVNTERDYSKYLTFSQESFTIKSESDNNEIIEIDSKYKCLRSDSYVQLSVSVSYDVILSLDSWFKFGVRIIKLSNNEEIDINIENSYDGLLNTKKILEDNRGKNEIVLCFNADISTGAYRLEFYNNDGITNRTIIFRYLDVEYYAPEDCIRIKKVYFTGDGVYRHKKELDSNIIIEGEVKSFYLNIEHDLLKEISSYKLEAQLIDADGKAQASTSFDIKETQISNLNVNDLSTNIYYLRIVCENKVLYEGKNLYVTGKRWQVWIDKDKNLNLFFREVVDNGKHYLIAERVVSKYVYNKMLGINDNENDNVPYSSVGKDMETIYNDIKPFIEKLKENNIIIKFSDKCMGPISLMTQEIWEHTFNNGNIDSKQELSSLGWFREDSKGKINNIGKKDPNLLGIYDIVGNIDSYVFYDERWYGFYKMVLVGGNYNESSKKTQLVKKLDGLEFKQNISVGLRLYIKLPPIPVHSI